MSAVQGPFAATRALSVVIVEDSENDTVLLLHELARSGYAVTHERVDTLPAFLRALEAGRHWDLVLSDFSLPTLTAHDVLRVLNTDHPDLPCIVISGTIAEEAAVDVLRAGARDFVVKQRMARLAPAIERELSEAVERRRLRAAEATLRDTRERMQFALEAVGVGTWETDLLTGQVHWSHVLERLHGLAPGSFEGRIEAFVERIHPDDRREVLAQVDRARMDQSDSRIEYRTVCPDGSTRWIAGIGRTFWDEGGVAVRAVGVGMDVTGQKRLEAQLRQSQKMESIGNLAGGIAHDFNNLLAVIAGCCDLAMREVAADSEAAESLEGIRSAAASASALTRQLLAFSRRQVVVPRRLDVNETIAGFRKVLDRVVEENVTVELELAPTLDMVRIDPGQIEQVLLNLVANARDAMPAGGSVRISTGVATLPNDETEMLPGVQPGAYVVLSVGDTGSGMSQDVQTRLFEPFFTTKPAGRGTGLGLATVYGIVKQSDGHICVQTEPGAGTTFRIYLPAVSASDYTPSDEERRPETGRAGNQTILVVEDNDLLRRTAERILRRHGYTVLTASDGAQARQICIDYTGIIHAALLDVIMPGESGPTVGEWICQRRPATGIIYMSGYTGDALDRHHVLRDGSVFLQKPFNARQLVQALRDLFAAPGGSGTPN